jgi:hypothetical protein
MSEVIVRECEDLLARWDAGESVWSVEMGGVGPGYEQAIQNTAFEVLRALVAGKYDAARWSDRDAWGEDRDAIEAAVFPLVQGEGLSGAQWGAALNIATVFYRQGHEAGRKLAGAGRAIQVSKTPSRSDMNAKRTARAAIAKAEQSDG